MNVALRIDRARRMEHVLGLAPVRARVHPERAADRARNPAIERKPRDARVGRGPRHLDVGHDGPGTNSVTVLDFDLAEPAPEPHDHARYAAVAHEQVRPEADDENGNAGRLVLQEIGEVGFVCRREQHFRRAADPEPRDVGQRRVRDASRPRRSGSAPLSAAARSGPLTSRLQRAAAPSPQATPAAHAPIRSSCRRRGRSPCRPAARCAG